MNEIITELRDRTVSMIRENPIQWPYRANRDAALVRLCWAAFLMDQHFGLPLRTSQVAYLVSQNDQSLEQALKTVQATMNESFETRQEVQ